MTQLADLCASVWALSALRVAADSGLLVAMAAGESNPRKLAEGARLDPGIVLRVLETLEAYGFALKKDGDGFVLTPEGADIASRNEWLRADLGATFGQTRAFVLEARASDLSSSGWRHVDAEVIRSQAALSQFMMAGPAINMMLKAAPAFEVLARPGASLLEVGSGAAGGAIGLCKRFPSLRVVALEPLRAARLEARTAIDAAGFGDRIELRGIRADELTDQHVHDASFVAASFMNDEALAVGLDRVRQALVPNGVLFVGAFRPVEDPKITTVSRLRWHLWGGGARTVSETTRIMKAAGLVDIQEGPSNGVMVPIVARTPG